MKDSDVIVEVFALPEGGEADYLLAGLRRLIELRGIETFVSAPVLLPAPEFFPDPVKPRAEGVAVLLRRLLAYANVPAERLDLRIYRSQDELLVRRNGDHGDALAWFMDIAQGVYRFGVSDKELRDELSLIGTLGHEVAHAYRTHHRLCVSDRELEEKLTDLTTVYLGFGAFTLESSFQFKTGHYNTSGQQLLYERQARGYLTPGQLAFLLAAELVVRSAREQLLPRVLAALSPNQAQAVESAYRHLLKDELALFEALGVPPVSAWPKLKPLPDALSALAPIEISLSDAGQPIARDTPEEPIGFRVAHSSAIAGVVVGLAIGFTVAMCFELVYGFWPLVLAFTVFGWRMGRHHVAPRCSGCAKRVPREAERCSSCSLKLVGDIQDSLDRLEAEEAYWTQRAQERESTRS